MNTLLAVTLVAVLVVGGALFAWWRLKGVDRTTEQAKAEAAEVASSESAVDAEAKALEERLGKDEASVAVDVARTAAKDAALGAELKAVEGGSDAFLDGYLRDHGLVEPDKSTLVEPDKPPGSTK